MIDISDGLSLDCWRLCQASGVGCTLDEQLLETIIHEDAKRASQEDGHSALTHALSDGEDFELLLATPDKDVEGLALIAIGKVTDISHEITMIKLDGSTQTLRPEGFVH